MHVPTICSDVISRFVVGEIVQKLGEKTINQSINQWVLSWNLVEEYKLHYYVITYAC